MAIPSCEEVYPKSFPWLSAFILVFSILTVVAYTAFYTNTVHLVGVYLFVLVLCVLVFVWNVAAALVLYRKSLRTSLILFSISIVVTLIIAGTTLGIYLKDIDFMSHIEFILVSVVIATSLAAVVFLCALVGVIARFKPSPTAVCRPFPQKPSRKR